MSAAKLAWRSLRFYWRTHLAVVLGVAVSTAVLVGALAVGDSVRHSLRTMALARLGQVELALAPQNRFFRDQLAADLEAELKTESDVVASSVLQLRGTAIVNGGAARANHVQVNGVEQRFWNLGSTTSRFTKKTSDEVVVNERLAQQLDLKPGDELLLRVERPSLLARDAPLSTKEDASTALRLTVAAIAGDADFGRFSLQANQIPPYNAFVPLEVLQQATGQPGRANMILMGGSRRKFQGETATKNLTPDAANAALRKKWQLADANLQLRELPQRKVHELSTERVFLEPAVTTAAMNVSPGAQGILGYFVNELRVGNRATPYSIVAAVDHPLMPSGMRDDEILINRWTAEDLQAKPGDALTLRYYVLGPMRQLEEKSARFRIRAIVPLAGAWADSGFMPAFPGIAEAENCRDWEPGIDIDLARIRPKDEVYWDRYRGAPKAFMTLRAGQRLWDNRFGNLTAVRYPSNAISRSTIEDGIRQKLTPAASGLYFQPVRQQALAAGEQALDFGQLFLAFSFFLIVAALLLTALLFALGIEQRSAEAGTLLGLGFTPGQVRRLFLQEVLVLVLLGSLIGAGFGTLYTRAVLHGLSTIWRGAVGTSALQYAMQPSSLLTGIVASILAALLTIWIVTRQQFKHSARQLLAGDFSHPYFDTPAPSHSRTPTRRNLLIALLAGIIAIGLVATSASVEASRQAPAFFGAGALLLLSALALCYVLLSTNSTLPNSHTSITLNGLGWRNAARRRGRSLATVSLLACASFLIVAVGANRRDPAMGMERRSSGSGGFALFGESTLPVYQDLNSNKGRETFGLDSLPGVAFVQLRVHEGDDASCLNLNRAQSPRLLGVRPAELHNRHAFSFVRTLQSTASPWLLLQDKTSDVVPAIGDQSTVVWGLRKSVGDTLAYTDERGKQFKIRLVGILANSILQGSLLISEENLVERFPAASGYRQFLIDAPSSSSTETARALSTALEDVGMELTPTTRRLAAFSAVENTYLSIFQALGGLGLLLGSVGLGLVVLRNALERRSELALLAAVGFTPGSLHRLVFSEHIMLALLGLGCGVAAALVAVLPALRSPGTIIPYASLAMTLSAVVISGGLWTWLATVLALRGPLLDALRNE
ncbi:MAG TPA: ABC transporter permease [Abditibacteriaceae bacterium]|nr:ABC transporter permease [Abditibacteriaceae bacterium]